MGQVLQVKAINSTVTRLYEAGDQYHVDNKVPEVGSNACFEDGRKFVFCSTDANLVAGQSVGASSGGVELTATRAAAVAVGDKEIRFVQASVTADLFKDGYLTVSLGTGLGYTYRIKGNTAAATVDAVANTVIATLYDEVCVAIAATDNIIVKRSRVSDIVQGGATTDPVGQAVVATTASTSGLTQYFWVQTAGVAMVTGTAGAEGIALTPAASGALGAAIAGNNIVAYGVVAGASHSQAVLCYPDA